MRSHTRIGLIGARGYVGETFLAFTAAHPSIEIAWVGSRSYAGERVCDVLDGLSSKLVFENVTPDRIPDADGIVLALPNTASDPFVRALDSRESKVLDLSADHRFDDDWVYGLPELDRSRLRGASRVSNPGCYATASALALAPVVDHLAETPSIFGVSGYSGAGKTPSPNNDPERLEDNLVPYRLTGHVHEREISRHLGHPVRFMPHVASFFRGISLTISATLDHETTSEQLVERYVERYRDEPLIEVCHEIPEVAQIRNRCTVTIGGFAADERDPRRIAVVATIDNLLKGAASQALQNLNLMFGNPELEGFPESH